MSGAFSGSSFLPSHSAIAQDKENRAGGHRQSEAYPPRQLPAAMSEKRAGTGLLLCQHKPCH